jgi:hypothetical protein
MYSIGNHPTCFSLASLFLTMAVTMSKTYRLPYDPNSTHVFTGCMAGRATTKSQVAQRGSLLQDSAHSLREVEGRVWMI